MEPDEIADLIDQAEQAEGDRLPHLLTIHDALRDALTGTDGDPSAAGR